MIKRIIAKIYYTIRPERKKIIKKSPKKLEIPDPWDNPPINSSSNEQPVSQTEVGS